MLETDSLRYIVEYVISVVASFLLFGTGVLLVYTRYKAQESIFYTKMIKQWIPAVFVLFTLIVIGRIIICYAYFPALFSSIFILTLYSVFVLLGTVLIFIVYFYSKKNTPASFIIYGLTLMITSLSELIILFFIAHTFYNGHIPYQEMLQPAFLLFLIRVLPYSLLFSSLLYILITIARRDKDTFGRDYYIFTLQYCTKIAYFSSMALALIGITSAIVLSVLLSTALYFSIFLCIIFFMPSLIFLYILFMLQRIRNSNTNPLQHKMTFSIALILALLALCIDIIAVQPYLL